MSYHNFKIVLTSNITFLKMADKFMSRSSPTKQFHYFIMTYADANYDSMLFSETTENL